MLISRVKAVFYFVPGTQSLRHMVPCGGMQGSFLPFLMWSGMGELGFHLVLLLSLTMYVGNAIKDLVGAPRPLGLQYGKERLKMGRERVKVLSTRSVEEVNLNAKVTAACSFAVIDA
jgi:hypothetical protein